MAKPLMAPYGVRPPIVCWSCRRARPNWYVVEAYTPSESIKFRFTGPSGFDGYHGFEVINHDGQSCVLRHTLETTTHGTAILSWLIAYRPMHDALIEDSLTFAIASMGNVARQRKWSAWVKVLRWLISKGKSRAQITPNPVVNTHRQ